MRCPGNEKRCHGIVFWLDIERSAVEISAAAQPCTDTCVAVTIDDIRAARIRLAPLLSPTPLRNYRELDDEVGHGMRVWVKHENFNPTGSFKVRNGLSFMTALPDEARARGVVAATRGNHGLGIAYAGRAFGVRTTVCVPLGNNPEKNAGMRALGARLVEEGRDYDESVEVANRVAKEEGATLAHSTNDRQVIAGAGTLSLELFEQEPEIDSLVIAIGGGSQAVGALTVSAALRLGTKVYGVQAEGAAAHQASWLARKPVLLDRAETIADGLATRSTYEMTFQTLLDGLADFITVSDGEIADAMRLLLRTTHTMIEPAGAAGLAGLRKLAAKLEGQRVGIVISGANVDAATLQRVLSGSI
jgi:threonine dehydratase